MREHPYKIFIALPSHILATVVESQLRKSLSVKCQVTQSIDLYTLPDQLKSLLPDIVITSPEVVSDTLLPFVKERCGLSDSKFVGIFTSSATECVLRNYNGKYSINDKESELTDLIEKIIDESTADPDDNKETALTPREKEIVVCVVKGMTNKEIASELYLSTHTVITHRRNIAKKLQIHSPAGLTIYAIVNNLVALSDIKEI